MRPPLLVVRHPEILGPLTTFRGFKIAEPCCFLGIGPPLVNRSRNRDPLRGNSFYKRVQSVLAVRR